MRTPILAGLAGLLLLPAGIDAQVTGYLTAYINENFNDISYATDFMEGSLDDGYSETWTIRLTPRESYWVVAACDDDCEDIDIEVRSAGRLRGEDVELDDFPSVQFWMDALPEVEVTVHMARCSVEPCYYALRIMN